MTIKGRPGWLRARGLRSVALSATILMGALAPIHARALPVLSPCGQTGGGPTCQGVVVGRGWSWASYESQMFLTISAAGGGGVGTGYAEYRTPWSSTVRVAIDCVAFDTTDPNGSTVPNLAYASGLDPVGNRVSMTIYDGYPLWYILDFMAVDVTASGSGPCDAPGSVNRVQDQDEFAVL